ncbi:MAG: hypothetical protein ACXVAK_19225, partial [Vulcanimicrobiaceae bacterium]
ALALHACWTGIPTTVRAAQKSIVEQSTGAALVPEGFAASTEIRFDESVGKPKATPVIPKSWRFVGVSNGERANSNNLWFQDAQGRIYLIQGFTTDGKFIVEPSVQFLNAK